ncbi:MAG TPA: cellulase family glycosylhydrolase [Candidatus Sulfotelmatobacter sp.]|nr:cellulase family glycosylhydrolase [Candidatus Sulfotelmatobacter sp.]
MGAIDGVRASIGVAAAIAALLAPNQVGAVGPDPGAPRSGPLTYTSAAAEVYSAKLPGFVTRSGATLLLDGQPYHFAGLNIYNVNNLGKCWYGLGTASAVDQALTAIGPGQNAFRAWFFQSLATTNGQRDWSAFDATLAVARAHDERVIVTLGNQHPDCEGPAPAPRTEAWYASGYARLHDAGMPSTYRDWVAEVVTRYRNNPTILAWQLMNEIDVRTPSGRCPTTAPATLKRFAQDMAGVVKGIDPIHLLSLGTWGLTDCGTAGSAYQDVHSVPGIDLCEVHDYSGPSTTLPGNLQLRLNQCRALNKPLFVGEMGIRVPDAGSLDGRASAFRTKFSAQFAAGAAGTLLWDWGNAGEAAYSGYEIQPGDPALQGLAGALR